MSGECVAEFVDGSWTSEDCGCEDCVQEQHDVIERAVEYGDITEDEAHDRHLILDQFG
jgi:hypothetical protein